MLRVPGGSLVLLTDGHVECRLGLCVGWPAVCLHAAGVIWMPSSGWCYQPPPPCNHLLLPHTSPALFCPLPSRCVEPGRAGCSIEELQLPAQGRGDVSVGTVRALCPGLPRSWCWYALAVCGWLASFLCVCRAVEVPSCGPRSLLPHCAASVLLTIVLCIAEFLLRLPLMWRCACPSAQQSCLQLCCCAWLLHAVSVISC